MPPRGAQLVALTVGLMLLGGAGRARAETDRTVIVPSFGARVHTGAIAEEYTWSFAVRVLSAIQPLRLGDSFRLGPAWWGEVDFFGAAAPGALGGDLTMLHFGLGVRAELAVPRAPSVDVVLLLGAELVSTAPPTPPDGVARSAGPMVGLGVELAITTSLVLTIDVAYSLIVGGPSGVSTLVGIQLGN